MGKGDGSKGGPTDGIADGLDEGVKDFSLDGESEKVGGKVHEKSSSSSIEKGIPRSKDPEDMRNLYVVPLIAEKMLLVIPPLGSFLETQTSLSQELPEYVLIYNPLPAPAST